VSSNEGSLPILCSVPDFIRNTILSIFRPFKSSVRSRTLTVKLRGRTATPDGAEGAQFPSARGAKPQAHHGPLQRLLEGITSSVPTKPMLHHEPCACERQSNPAEYAAHWGHGRKACECAVLQPIPLRVEDDAKVHGH